MKKYSIAVLGTGARSFAYFSAYASRPELEIAAVADVNPAARETVLGKFSFSAREYGDFHDLAQSEKNLDGVVITLPNHLHAAAAIPFIRRGIPVMLEKPMTTTMRDTESILLELEKSKSRLMTGFVLRSVEFYKKIHGLLSAGTIGNIVTIQADELAGLYETRAIMLGTWRRYTATSGGSMMEKSSHDMDILNYLASSRVVSMACFGGSNLFSRNALLPDSCEKCAVAEKCLYSCRQRGTCIYNVSKDVFDTQSVTMKYENGVVANFMLTFDCHGERSGRNIHITGTRGRIWGNVGDNTLSYFVNGSDKAVSVQLPVPETGHYGGDVPHALEFLKMLKDSRYSPENNAYAGYLANASCIAADRSLREGRLMKFTYDSNGFVSF